MTTSTFQDPDRSTDAIEAEDVVRSCIGEVGPAAWPIVRRIVIEGDGLASSRTFVSTGREPIWDASLADTLDAIILDRLRVALDRIGEVLEVQGKEE
jgi:hypothetical protein